MSPEIITKDCRPMTPGERLRAYLERREYALAAGHGVTCEVVDQFVDANKMVEKAKPNNISRFLRRKGGAK